MFWPPNSPDLSPIENIWAILKRNIGKVFIKTKAELIDVITIQINRMSIETINSTIDTMDNRVDKLFNNSFDSIDY